MSHPRGLRELVQPYSQILCTDAILAALASSSYSCLLNTRASASRQWKE
jgi:hypothetical protein